MCLGNLNMLVKCLNRALPLESKFRRANYKKIVEVRCAVLALCCAVLALCCMPLPAASHRTKLCPALLHPFPCRSRVRHRLPGLRHRGRAVPPLNHAMTLALPLKGNIAIAICCIQALLSPSQGGQSLGPLSQVRAPPTWST